MKGTDKFLFGIVIGVILLALSAFGISMLRADPAYMEEDTPTGVVNNYLVALQEEDYERAYGYLYSRLPGYPKDADQFYADIINSSWSFRTERSPSLTIVKEDLYGTMATVTVDEEIFYEGILFDGGQSSNRFTFKLFKTGDTWKIREAKFYWFYCWTNGNCR